MRQQLVNELEIVEDFHSGYPKKLRSGKLQVQKSEKKKTENCNFFIITFVSNFAI